MKSIVAMLALVGLCIITTGRIVKEFSKNFSPSSIRIVSNLRSEWAKTIFNAA
ncbi:hypothetical protein BDV26DRAFT_251802 [Aspergillus bertholletiae]|uniref:Uncharacterized protein n=1 Tax=Aspergillus bertholletiae TaxID=1226010 RepID=A0A5N7BNR0_9EURO|nr:hypothetical protein BDV26DRAFT_251802 [Aspergillus bertholletiae]